MTLETVKELIKEQFKGISIGLFQNSISIQEIEKTNRIFAEASRMFGLNILKYSESNYEYFYTLLKYMLNAIDIVDLKILGDNYSKLNSKQDLLSMKLINAISSYKVQNVNNTFLFLQLNLILNLFVFLHECGHLNQEVKGNKDGKASNHFSEFNADYYAQSTILHFYFTMKTSQATNYLKTVSVFGGESNFVRVIISISFLVIFLELLPEFTKGDTDTHPAIRKRFCYLIYQAVENVNDNFKSVLAGRTIKEFAIDIFNTLQFIEDSLFDNKEKVFTNLLISCLSNFDEVKSQLNDSKLFDKFNP